MTDRLQLEVDFGINNGYSPGEEGPRAFGYNVTFPGTSAEVLVDLTLAQDLGFIANAQGIFIDNTGNVGVSLRIPGVEQTIRIPPQSQMIGPIALPRSVTQLYFTSNEAKTIRFHLFNVPLPFAVYSTQTSEGQQTSPTSTKSNVAGAASDTLILAANAARTGAAIYNDSTAILYLSLGTTAASATSYTVAMAPSSYYETPALYTGMIRGIWASATGSARVTEVS